MQAGVNCYPWSFLDNHWFLPEFLTNMAILGLDIGDLGGAKVLVEWLIHLNTFYRASPRWA